MTNLAKYKNDWESLAEHDALWAILTDESKVGGKWDLVEFMATSEAEIRDRYKSFLRPSATCRIATVPHSILDVV